jgi:hypothetical protein
MVEAIFATYALQFERTGFAAIPVVPGQKKPAIKDWQNAAEMTSEQRREAYSAYGQGNIGLLAGTTLPTGDRFGFIDIDHPGFVRFIRTLLAPFVSGKVGQKGLTVFCRVADGVKSAKLKPKGARAPFCEVFASTGQTVVPPSIHPNGGRYTWVGKSLLDIDPGDLPLLTPTVAKVLALVVKNSCGLGDHRRRRGNQGARADAGAHCLRGSERG